MDGRQCAPKGNGHRGAATGGAGSSGKRKGSKQGAGGGKKPIKVVYIDNPMRVSTTAEGFRALVQELTGRHADPSKYSGGSPAIDVDCYSSGGSLQAEPQPGALLSPGGSTEGSSDVASAAAAGLIPAQALGYCGEDEEESFMPQLIDNSYSVFSPPTFLYGHYSDLM